MSFTLNQLAQRFSGRIAGDGERQIEGLAPLDGAGPHQLAFLANPKYLTQVVSTRAAAVLITEHYFADSVDKPPPAGVHPSAFIDPSARLAPSASIGPYTVIEANAVVGERAR